VVMKDRTTAKLVIACFLSAFVASGTSIVYTGVSQANNNEELQNEREATDRQWCELLAPLDKAYSTTLPATELGRSVARAIHNIADKFDC
jgi:hypothetical protein